MAFRDVLVHVATEARRAAASDGGGDGKTSRHALDLACRVADAHEARLTGLGSAPAITSGFYGPAWIPAGYVEQLLEESRTALAAAESRFRAALNARPPSAHGEWREDDTDTVAALAEAGLTADLIVVDQSDPAREGPSFGLPAELALTCGRPVLVAPYIGLPDTLGQRILLAWNASREAARAVADAMPFLTRADSVDVLLVSPRGAEGLPGAEIARHLAAHGVQAEIVLRESDLEAGTEMLNFASDRGSDMIVMGCYGHHRLRQAVFGGATRTVLSQMPVPVLLSH